MNEPTITWSASVGQIVPALLAAKREMGPLVKNAVNPHLKNKYANLEATLDVIEPALLAHGILMMQGPGGDGDVISLDTLLMHESGEWFRSVLTLKPSKQANPQDAGSVVTYARRYSLQGIFALAAEDDDGNAGSGRNKPVQHLLLDAPPDRKPLDNAALVALYKTLDPLPVPTLGAWLVQSGIAPNISKTVGPTAEESMMAEDTILGMLVRGPGELVPVVDRPPAPTPAPVSPTPKPAPSRPQKQTPLQPIGGVAPEGGISPGQRMMIMAMLHGAGINTDDERHAYATKILGEGKGSTKSWTPVDVDTMKKALEGNRE